MDKHNDESKGTYFVSVGKNAIRTKGNLKKEENSKNKALIYGMIIFAVIIIAAVFMIVYFSVSSSYVAKVGNDKVSEMEFRFLLSSQKNYMLRLAQSSDPGIDADNFWTTMIEGESTLDIAKKNALEGALELKIQLSMAEERGLKLTADELAYIDTTADSYLSADASRTQKDEFFNENFGVNYNEFKTILRESLLINSLYKELTDEMVIDDKMINEYYEQNKEGLEKVKMGHILILVEEDAAEEEKDEALKKAEDIIKKVNSGDDFAALAKEYSEDPGSKDTGGTYDFKRGEMVAEFEEWSFSHVEGDTGIVKTNYGYHVMKHMGFIDMFEEVKEMLYNMKFQEAIDGKKKEPKYAMVTNEKVYNSIN